MTNLPKELCVSRHMYYDVQNIVETILHLDMDRDPDSITLEEVTELALEYAYDDFSTLQDFEPIITDMEGNLLN
jgi:hypothetical protein